MRIGEKAMLTPVMMSCSENPIPPPSRCSVGARGVVKDSLRPLHAFDLSETSAIVRAVGSALKSSEVVTNCGLGVWNMLTYSEDVDEVHIHEEQSGTRKAQMRRY